MLHSDMWIFRSPGGTPLRQRPRQTEGSDPASLIAAALKRKFAHRYKESPDKENTRSDSPFSPQLNSKSPASPVKPPFGRHLLKPMNRGEMGETVTRQSPLKPVN